MNTLLPLLLLAAAPAFAAPAACPDAGEQLTEYLASAKQRIGSEGEVRVEFEVGADGRAQVLGLRGTRRYQGPVRIAMNSLDCRAGTPHRYTVNLRFADPMPRTTASAASATLAQPPADPPTPR